MDKARLTIVILTFNEEANIGNCLDGVAGVDAPVFVVDSGSTDRTLAILGARDVTVTHHPFGNYAAQRNWAQANIPWDTEWVLHLDAGETCLPGLTEWLRRGFDPGGRTDGYLFARRAVFMGEWMRHGGYHPIYHLRLFRRALGRCEAKVYDQHFVCGGEVATAPQGADLADGVMSNLRDFTVAHARWALFEAIEQVRSAAAPGDVDAKLTGSPIERRRWLKTRVFDRVPIFWRSILYFLHRYVIRLGFLDGTKGLIFHGLQGFWFRFLVDATIYEIREVSRGRPLRAAVLEHYGVDLDELLRYDPEADDEAENEDLPGPGAEA